MVRFGIISLLVLFQLSVLYSQNSITINDSTYYYYDAETALMNAAADGDTMLIKVFLELGTNVNAETWEGVTPLMYAAQEGHLRAVEILLDAGADVNKKPANQIDALLGACIAGHVYIADTLILNGANVNTRNLDGVSPLMYAAAFDYQVLADVLIFYKANINASDNFGNEAIHYSTFYGNAYITELLITSGARIDATDLQGFTPLMIAAQNGYPELVAYFIDLGAEVNTTNMNNYSALSLALINRQSGIVEQLLNAGADVNHKISENLNQYDLAELYGNSHIRSSLRERGAAATQKIRVDHFIMDFDMNFNGKDFMLGGRMGLLESKYNVQLTLGYQTRPSVRSVLYEADPNTYYQYWESRSLVDLSVNKFFVLKKINIEQQFGAYAGLKGAYTYGNFRGSNQKPDDRFLLIPAGGIYFDYNILRVKLGYEYLNLKNSKASPHRIYIGIGMNIGTKAFQSKLKDEPRM